MHFITYAKKLAAYRIEILLFLSIVATLSLCFIVATSQKQAVDEFPEVKTRTNDNEKYSKVDLKNNTIFVEISGAVYKPGVYELPKGSRLDTLLGKAEGLNKQADKGFFFRNYNQARVLEDGEKIHAPSLEEIARGSFVEQPLIIYTNKIGVAEAISSDGTKTQPDSNTGLISIGKATSAELESLPGVGAVTAEKIISARPYLSIEDLRTKGIVSESLFIKIQPLVSL